MSDGARSWSCQGIRRRFVQGEAVLDVLQGDRPHVAARARWSRWSAPRAPASRRCCTSRACSRRPTGGEVVIGGHPAPSSATASARRCAASRIGFVYQFHHLLPDSPRSRTSMLPQLVAGVPRSAARGRAADLLDRLGLPTA